VKNLLLIVLFLALQQGFAMAQCQAVLRLTDDAYNNIHDVYQFTCFNKQPKNRLDILLKQCLNPNKIIDSAFYDWTKVSPLLKPIDRFKYELIVDEIGKQKSEGAFLLLHLYVLLPFKMQDDLSPFVGLASTVHYHKASTAINKYFLNNAISTKLPKQDFENAVFAKSLLLKNKYLSKIKYCKLLQGNARALYEMKQINAKPYDDTIIAVMNKYLNKNDKRRDYFSIDSIFLEVYQLPFRVDAVLDNCIAKVAVPEGLTEIQLGVIINAGVDDDGERRTFERVYTISNHPAIGQTILAPRYDVGFVNKIRVACEQE
jgi:hypothetical protein